MIKAVVFAAAILGCAPLVSASTPSADLAVAGGSTSTPAVCRTTGGLDPACPLHVGDVADTAPLALAEQPDAPDAGFAFKDIAFAPATILASTREHDGRKPLAPALFSLLAMVVLLSRRNTFF